MRWVKSSYSKGDGACLELARDGSSTVLVRNSRNPERGMLALPASAVAAFVASCAAGEMDELTA
jgi:hypothetical protein